MTKLRLKAEFDGLRIREAPVDGKSVGQLHAGEVMEALEDDATLLTKVGVDGEWVQIKTHENVTGYTAAWMLEFEGEAPKAPEKQVIQDSAPKPDPTPTTPKVSGGDASDQPRLAVRPTIKALRMRAAPVDGDQVGLASDATVLIADEDETTARGKIGVEGEWLRCRTLWDKLVYVAAWFLQIHDGPIPEMKGVPDALNTTGMNLDARHPLGAPDPSRLQGLGWVRLGYNVSAATGSEDLRAAYDLYAPYIDKCNQVGLKVMLVFTHQTYGEGKNEYWPWPQMTTSKWHKLSGRLQAMIAKIAEQYRGRVHCYQVWNEQDAHIGAVASVPMTPTDYGIILGDTIKTIRGVDPQAYIITGGHTGGPVKGSEYARTAINAAGIEPDGVAFHPYGRGITEPQPPYTIFGHIDDSMNHYSAVLPGKPVWITEWGVLDRPNDPSQHILDYAADVVNHLKSNYPNGVATMIWYAWAMGMHNGYGLVNQHDQPIQPLNDGFRKL